MTDGAAWSVFETALGPCGIVWRGERILGAVLPDEGAASVEAVLRRRHPGARKGEPSSFALGFVDRVRAMFEGRAQVFTAEGLDFGNAPAFNQSVYLETLKISYGGVSTYGEIARSLGGVELSQAVGQALGANPIPIIVPCHRVLGAGGRTGGFSGARGVKTKLALLNVERAGRTEGLLFEELPLLARPKAAAMSREAEAEAVSAGPAPLRAFLEET